MSAIDDVCAAAAVAGHAIMTRADLDRARELRGGWSALSAAFVAELDAAIAIGEARVQAAEEAARQAEAAQVRRVVELVVRVGDEFGIALADAAAAQVFLVHTVEPAARRGISRHQAFEHNARTALDTLGERRPKEEFERMARNLGVPPDARAIRAALEARTGPGAAWLLRTWLVGGEGNGGTVDKALAELDGGVVHAQRGSERRPFEASRVWVEK